MGFRHPQPNNEDDFELFCLRLLRTKWGRPHLQQNGKRGERQHGIDLIDLSGASPFRAVQCKHKEATKTLPPKEEVEDEVEKALQYDPPLDEYYILTTARKAGEAQSRVIKINQKHAKEGKFLVVLWFWDEIEQCLDEMDEVSQDKVLRGDASRSVANLQAVIPPLLQRALDELGPRSPSGIDAEFDAIKGEIELFRLDAATQKLDSLEARLAHKFDDRQWFRLLTLRANLAIPKGEWRAAAELLLKAKSRQPLEERARVNEALAYELGGDRDGGHALASSLRGEFPASARLGAIWVRTAPADVTSDAVESAVAGLSDTDGDLALSLAYRALQRGETERGLSHAGRVLALCPESPQAWFVKAQLHHEQSARQAGRWAKRSGVSQAEEAYAKALDLAVRQGVTEIQAASRLNRAILRAISGDPRAELDFQAAVDLRPSDEQTRLHYGHFLLDVGRLDDVICQAAAASSPDATVLACVARYERNRGDDRKAALGGLAPLAAGADLRAAQATHLALEIHIDAGRWDEAEALLATSALQSATPAWFFTLRARLCLARGDAQGASLAADGAVLAAAGDAPQPVLRNLAHVLVNLGRDADALGVLERCARPGQFDLDTRRLLDCANRLGRHEVVLRVCRELREAGEDDRRLFDNEVNILQAYDPAAAVALLREFLGRNPGDRTAKLWLSFLALRLGRSEFVDASPDAMPSPAEVGLADCKLAVAVLHRAARYQEALEYAYVFLRHNFDSKDAHGIYAFAFLMGERLRPPLRVPDACGVGVAVGYTEDGHDQVVWLVIEEERCPKVPDERGRRDRLAESLIGKRVGESFTLAPGDVQERRATVRALADRYAYRQQDCLNQFQVRFQDSSFIQVVRVINDGQFDPTPVWKTLDTYRAHVEQVEALYRDNPLPVAAFAAMAGRDDVEVLDHLVTSGRLHFGLRVCGGGGEEMQQAAAAFRAADTVVLDVTALYALARLERLDVLASVPGKRLVVSQNTHDLLARLVSEAERAAGAARIFARPEPGGLLVTDADPQAGEQQRAFLQSLLAAVRERCEVRGCLRLAALEPSRRDGIQKAVGTHGADTIALAAEPGSILWSDDGALAMLARGEFKADRVWSQMVLHHLSQAGAVSLADFNRASARLLGMRYRFTWSNCAIILEAGSMADWKPDRWPLGAALDQFGDQGIDSLTRVRLAAETVQGAWRQIAFPLTQHVFLAAILARLGRLSLIHRLCRVMPQYFGIDTFAANDVVTCITLWVQQSGSALLP